MRKLLEGSHVVRWINASALFIDRQWERSLVSRALTAGSVQRRDMGRLGSAARGVRELMCLIYEKLRLERLFEGSILTRAFLWCTLAAVLAPVIPTMALLALVMLGTLAVILCFAGSRERRLLYSPVNKWIFLYAALYMFSTFLSRTPAESLRHGLLYTSFMLFAVIVPNALGTRENAERVIRLMVFVGLIVACGGIYQVAFRIRGTESWVDESMFGGMLRAYSTLENPNVLSEYLLLIMPLGAALAITERGRAARVAAGVAAAAMAVCVFVTYSRGGYLGLIVTAALFLVLLDRRFLVLGVAAVLLSPAVLPRSIIDRVMSIGNMGDSSTSYRVMIWAESAAMMKDYWLTGIGTGPAPYAKLHRVYGVMTPDAQHAHSLYLQVLCECGVFGLAALLGVFLSFVRTAAHGIRSARDKNTRVMLVAILSGAAGFMVQSLTDYSFYNYRVTLIFWAVIGLGIFLASPYGGLEDD